MTPEDRAIAIACLRRASLNMDKARKILSKDAKVDLSCSLNLCVARVNDITDDVEAVRCKK